MELLMEVALLFASLNCVLLLGLLYMYGKIFTKTRARYTAGLLFFASFLLIHNLFTVVSYVTMTASFGDELYPFLAGITIFEFGGLLALLKVTF